MSREGAICKNKSVLTDNIIIIILITFTKRLTKITAAPRPPRTHHDTE